MSDPLSFRGQVANVDFLERDQRPQLALFGRSTFVGLGSFENRRDAPTVLSARPTYHSLLRDRLDAGLCGTDDLLTKIAFLKYFNT